MWSSCDNEPLSTANVRNIHRLGDLLYSESQGVYVDADTTVGMNVADLLGQGSNVNVYRVDVEGHEAGALARHEQSDNGLCIH